MLALFIQTSIIGLWGTLLLIHVRRLLRMARVHMIDPIQRQQRRQQLKQIWWWLGQREFWLGVQSDTMRCLQLTLMVTVFVWS